LKKLITALTLLATFLFASPAFAYTIQVGEITTKSETTNILPLQELEEDHPLTSNLNLIDIEQNVTSIQLTTTTEQKVENDSLEKISISESEMDLLARLVRAEAQTEPFEGKIAVACVVLNRVESPKFPNTIKDVIYTPGQFQPVLNGEIHKPADEESINAVKAALTEHRQIATESLFFYNPAIATSRWLDSRPTTLVIGQHVFKK
jgi:N-acetylmuramoyl-L-alanine amidase